MTANRLAVNDSAGRFIRVLGEAALDLWSELPRELQERLFERAVFCGHKTERDESLREQLAQFLHDRHERTSHERTTHDQTTHERTAAR